MFPKGPIILSVLYTISLIKCSEAGYYKTDIEAETTMMNFLVDGFLEDSVNHLKIEEEKQEESKDITSNSLFYEQLEENNNELSMEIVTPIPWNIFPLNSTKSQDTTTTINTTATTTAEEIETLLPCVLEKSWCLIIILCAIACTLIFIRIFIFLEERKNIFPYDKPYGPVHDSIV